jgi:hypothetical protein
MISETVSKLERIRALNDHLRRSFIGGKVVATRGVTALDNDDFLILLNLLNDFDDFTPDNDPHGEHDFGAVMLNGARYFWKIDYYDPTLTSGSADPSDDSITTRVLTIMRADEY